MKTDSFRFPVPSLMLFITMGTHQRDSGTATSHLLERDASGQNCPLQASETSNHHLSNLPPLEPFLSSEPRSFPKTFRTQGGVTEPDTQSALFQRYSPRPPGSQLPPAAHFGAQCVRSVASVVSNSLRPHGLQPTRLLCPWDFPSKPILDPRPR